MKGGADIYDQQMIRRYVEEGGSDAAAIADQLLITEQCAQEWMDFYNGKEIQKVEPVPPVIEDDDEWAVEKEKVVITSKKPAALEDDHGTIK